MCLDAYVNIQVIVQTKCLDRRSEILTDGRPEIVAGAVVNLYQTNLVTCDNLVTLSF